MSLIPSTITLSISTSGPTVTKPGYGIPIILSGTAAWVERTRSYTTLAALAVDFAATTGEYLCAVQIFAQDPAPSTVMVGRCALPPTMRWSIGVTVVANSTAYKVKVGSTTYTYTSDASATNDEIATGLAAAIDAHAGIAATTTGSVGSLTVRITADAAGTFFDIHTMDPSGVVSTDYLSIAQDNADPGVATDLTALLAASKAWYAVVSPYTSSAMLGAILSWVGSNKRVAILDTQDSGCADVADGSATDIMKVSETAARARGMLLYHPKNGNFAGAAWAGVLLPKTPGKATAAFKTLASVDTVTLTDTQRTNILDKHGNVYDDFGGVGATFEGWCPSGAYFDLVRDTDWLESEIWAGYAQLQLDNDKIPFTDAGVAMIRSMLEGVLRRAERAGVLAAGWRTEADPVSGVSSTDKGNRLYPDLRFYATYQSAIHKAIPVTGVIAL